MKENELTLAASLQGFDPSRFNEIEMRKAYEQFRAEEYAQRAREIDQLKDAVRRQAVQFGKTFPGHISTPAPTPMPMPRANEDELELRKYDEMLHGNETELEAAIRLTVKECRETRRTAA